MKKIILSSVMATSFLFAGFASAAPSNQYIATGTDTFWTISQKLNINLSELLKANPQVNPQNVYAGVVIKLPSSNPAPQQRSREDLVDSIISKGMTQLGTPYVFGGDKPNIALDCSGLVQYAFNENGFNLPHSSSMISQLGTPVDKDNLQKGDLVFLQGTYTSGVSHVAIYLGNNKILHASSSGTGAVKISTFFGTPYYDSHYWGARRLIR